MISSASNARSLMLIVAPRSCGLDLTPRESIRPCGYDQSPKLHIANCSVIVSLFQTVSQICKKTVVFGSHAHYHAKPMELTFATENSTQ